MKAVRTLLITGLWLASIGGCAPNVIHRDKIEACPANDPEFARCSIEDHRAQNYILGFVEFDDQGIPYTRPSDGRNQMDALFDRMLVESGQRDLCIIIFVHGWKHNAAADDSNVNDFRILLSQVANMEGRLPITSQREVFGIYAGWRGLSLHATPIDENLTFWTRKATAERVAEGSIRALLARAKAHRDVLNTSNWPSGRPHHTRMLTIGHSFGGLIVYSAVAQYLTDQAAALEVKSAILGTAPNGEAAFEKQNQIAGYGDLVVVINPAIEATRYEPIAEIVNARPPRGFAPWQPPVFIEVTSVGDKNGSGDWATGIVFPIGRFFSTMAQDVGGSFRTGEYSEALAAFGHYSDFWTHSLTNTNPAATNAETLSPVDLNKECEYLHDFDEKYRPDGYLPNGWARTYTNGAQLRALEESKSDPNNPYWIIRADPSIILDHTHITKGVFLDFVRQVYDDIVIMKDEEMKCR
jgi:pimeloyl-ACP methyl ester carboxylesterase